MDYFISGNVLMFTTTFLDAAGEPVNPATAVLTLRTATPGTESVTVTLDMTETDGVWTAEWDTTGIAAGIIYWAVKATSPHAADQGVFDLTANFANAV